MSELEPIYLIVVRDWGREVLVEAGSRSLPCLELSPDADLVRAVADGVQRRYGVDLCVLFSFDSPEIERHSDPDDLTWTPIPGTGRRVVVCQPWSDPLPHACRLTWAPVADVTGEEHALQSLLRALQLLWDRAIGRVRAPFGRCQWFQELIAHGMPCAGAAPVPRLTHWGGGETASVIRMESQEHDLWLRDRSCPPLGETAGLGPRNSERRAPAGEQLSGRGEMQAALGHSERRRGAYRDIRDGDGRQWRPSERVRTTRCAADRPATLLWLKAAAAPETPMKLVSSLTHLGIPYVPAAREYIRSDRGGWDAVVQEHIEGVPLRDSEHVSNLLETACRAAEIQVATIGKADALLASGCEAWTGSRIQRGSRQLFHWIASEAFTRGDLLGIAACRGVLPSLSERLQAALDELWEFDIPYTLIRHRFSPDDVVVHRSQGPHFVSWSASAVSFPFAWWPRLEAAAARHDASCSASALCEAYLNPWRAILDAKTVARGMQSAPLVAALLDVLRAARMEEIIGEYEYLPAEMHAWAWELVQDPARLDVLRQSLGRVIWQLEDREAAA